jgi:hypothetical protein
VSASSRLDVAMNLARRSDRVLAFLALLGGICLWTFVDAAWLRTRRARALAGQAEFAAQLGLTDVCLFTEARYTRHLSQADLHSPFQDHPGALEHFPSGSLVAPPDSLTTRHAHLVREAEVPD